MVAAVLEAATVAVVMAEEVTVVVATVPRLRWSLCQCE
jgi:hypothetical protein